MIISLTYKGDYMTCKEWIMYAEHRLWSRDESYNRPMTTWGDILMELISLEESLALPEIGQAIDLLVENHLLLVEDQLK
jgi:hypothetical protein